MVVNFEVKIYLGMVLLVDGNFYSKIFIIYIKVFKIYKFYK